MVGALIGSVGLCFDRPAEKGDSLLRSSPLGDDDPEVAERGSEIGPVHQRLAVGRLCLRPLALGL